MKPLNLITGISFIFSMIALITLHFTTATISFIIFLCFAYILGVMPFGNKANTEGTKR